MGFLAKIFAKGKDEACCEIKFEVVNEEKQSCCDVKYEEVQAAQQTCCN